MRAQLVLGKYRVIERTGNRFRLALGGTTEFTVDLPIGSIEYDIRAGDLLTVYTEVLVKPKGM
jgi:hypothetical protein